MENDKALALNKSSVPSTELEEDEDVVLGGKLSARDIAIPYLYILQVGSPQVNADNAKHIKGATASMLYLTVVEEVYDGREEGLIIVPCFYERIYNEWVNRDKGGGLVASYHAESEIVAKAQRNAKGQPFMPNGNMLVETAYHYLLVKRRDGTYTQAVFPLKSTALKESRKWNSTITTKKKEPPNNAKAAPRFYYEYKLFTKKEGAEPQVWSGPLIKETNQRTSDEVYNEAKEFAKIAATGMLRRPLDEQAQESNGDGLI